jgi:uncharacterized protein (TIGR00255 family)
MTGFGSASSDDFTVEIRSLNHRFMDISLRMPPYMNQSEIALRNILKSKFRRGRFDVSISLNTAKAVQLTCNKDLARNIYAALRELREELSISGEINLDTLTSYKEILMEEKPAYDIDALYRIFESAVASLEEMRIREGGILQADIHRRISSLADMISRIKSLAPDEVARWREKFMERLKLIVDSGMIDNTRVLQEAALMAEKLDIAEEISRIEGHIQQFSEILNSNSEIGKRLDFMLQELNREANTLSYKAGDYAISNIVVNMKTEIEKIREQVQNIE